jgi:dCTP deaminase
MPYWSSEKLFEMQTNRNIIQPFQPKRVKHGAYELSLGNEVYVTSHPDGTKQQLTEHEQVKIPPGQFALLITKESVCIPTNTLGFISIKAGVKFRGLVNVSGFHLDPGFEGHIKFSVYNAGSQDIILASGEPLFLMWIADLDRTTEDKYNGAHANQEHITPEDIMRIHGEVASPGELNTRLKEIERAFAISKAVVIGVIITAVGAYIKIHLEKSSIQSPSSSTGIHNAQQQPLSSAELKAKPKVNNK